MGSALKTGLGQGLAARISLRGGGGSKGGVWGRSCPATPVPPVVLSFGWRQRRRRNFGPNLICAEDTEENFPQSLQKGGGGWGTWAAPTPQPASPLTHQWSPHPSPFSPASHGSMLCSSVLQCAASEQTAKKFNGHLYCLQQGTSNCEPANKQRPVALKNVYVIHNDGTSAQTVVHNVDNDVQSIHNDVHTAHNDVYSAHNDVYSAHNDVYSAHNDIHSVHNDAHMTHTTHCTQ